MSNERKFERAKQAVPTVKAPAPPSPKSDEEIEDEMFEQELVGHYASFIAGTPFVTPPDDA